MHGLSRSSRLALASIALASISSASVLVVLSGAPSYACAFWRLAISAAIVAAYILLAGARVDLGLYETLYSITAGAFLAAHFLLWMESLFHIPVAVSTTLVVTYPLYNAVIDCIVFREKPSVRQVAGLIMGFSGVLGFLHPGVSAGYSVYGIALALAGSAAAAIYFTLGRAVRRSGVSLASYTLVAYSTAAAFTLAYSMAIGGNIVSYPPRTYAFFIMLAVIPMIGGHTVMNYMLKHMRSSTVSSIALGEPVGASILAWIILGQRVTAIEAALMAIVISSVALIVLSEE